MVTTALSLMQRQQAALQKNLVQEARAYAEQSRSSATKKAYLGQWRTWEKWARQAGLQAFPAAPEAVALYITWRAQQGRSVSTLSQGLSAITHMHVMQNAPDPVQSREVKVVWDGIRRAHGVAPRRQAAPLTPDLLLPIIEALPWGTCSVRDRALLLVGFAGGFRRSEVATLRVEDVSWKPQGMVLFLRKSKSDQEGKGRYVSILAGANRATCPVEALRDWLRLSGITKGPVFQSTIGRREPVKLRGKALYPKEVSQIIKRRARAVGFDVKLLSGHSLRSGLVTTATRAEVSDHRIMDQTGHKSPAMVRRYRREAEHMKDDFTKKLGL